MKTRMYRLSTIFGIVSLLCTGLVTSKTIAQTIGGGYGWGSIYTTMPIPLLNAYNTLNDGDVHRYISGTYPIYSKWISIASFTQTSSQTTIQIRFDGQDGDFSRGASGVKLYQFELGAGYQILNKASRLYLVPYSLAGLQISKLHAKYSNFFPIEGPYYWQTREIKSGGYNLIQATFALGLKFGVKILQRIQIGINLRAFYAPCPVEKLSMYYYHKDSPQIERYAEFSSSGAGLYRSLNMEIILGKRIPKRTKTKHVIPKVEMQ